uniref:Kinesin motor domain-containing protein n=1 Tax=Glossina brevipalpis TaxID=37001 RepID=A0A1A9WJF3_9MUSC
MSTERELELAEKQNLIKVFCRFCPSNSGREKKSGYESKIECPVSLGENSLTIGDRVYNFDKIFSASTPVENVYNESGKFIVNHVLNGYNGSIFTYGSLLSNKLFTSEQEFMNLIVGHIFKNKEQTRALFDFAITVSYYEIYMEKIYDLLNTKAHLTIVDHSNGEVDVRGATERSVLTSQDIFEALNEGKLRRHSTKSGNIDRSSHSVFVIKVKRNIAGTQHIFSGKLYLVDLATSVKMSKTGTVPTEARSINRSLLTFGNILSKLNAGEKTHMRYRDSKLTRLLQDALNPNAKVSVMLGCSANAKDEDEIRSVLEFGCRLKTASHNEVLTVVESSGSENLKQFEVNLTRCRSEGHISTDSALERSSLNSKLNDRLMSDSDSCIESLCSQHSAELKEKEEEINQLYEDIENLKQNTLERFSITKIVSEYNAMKRELLSTQKANEAVVNNNKSLCTKEDIDENLIKLKGEFTEVLQILSSSESSIDVNPIVLQGNSTEDKFSALKLYMEQIKCLAKEITQKNIATEHQLAHESDLLNNSMPMINNSKENDSLLFKTNRKPKRSVSVSRINEGKQGKHNIKSSFTMCEEITSKQPTINNPKENGSLLFKTNRKPKRSVSVSSINEEKQGKQNIKSSFTMCEEITAKQPDDSNIEKRYRKTRVIKKNKKTFKETKAVSEAFAYLENLKETDMNPDSLGKFKEEKIRAFKYIRRIREIDHFAFNNDRELVYDYAERCELTRLERNLRASIQHLKSFKRKGNDSTSGDC